MSDYGDCVLWNYKRLCEWHFSVGISTTIFNNCPQYRKDISVSNAQLRMFNSTKNPIVWPRYSRAKKEGAEGSEWGEEGWGGGVGSHSKLHVTFPHYVM